MSSTSEKWALILATYICVHNCAYNNLEIGNAGVLNGVHTFANTVTRS